MNIKELYQEIILEHGKNPRNLRKTDNFNKDAKGNNPLCGDNVHIFLKLDEDGVAIRAGHHCCQILHDKLGISASARASLGVYNTKEDLDQLNSSINNCKKIFNL